MSLINKIVRFAAASATGGASELYYANRRNEDIETRGQDIQKAADINAANERAATTATALSASMYLRRRKRQSALGFGLFLDEPTGSLLDQSGGP